MRNTTEKHVRMQTIPVLCECACVYKYLGGHREDWKDGHQDVHADTPEQG